MSLQKTQSGLWTVSNTCRQNLSGDDRQGGEVLTMSNQLLTTGSDVDGWYDGTGTIIRTGGATYYPILPGHASPLGALGTGSFLQGFTADGTYAYAVYFQLLSNTTGHLGASTKNMTVYLNDNPGTGTFLTLLANPGDCFLAYYSNSASSVSPTAPKYVVYLDGVATVTFRLLVNYRIQQYPS